MISVLPQGTSCEALDTRHQFRGSAALTPKSPTLRGDTQ